MDVRWVGPEGTRSASVAELAGLLAGPEEGFVWVDVPPRDPDGVSVLADVFAFHPHALQDAIRRNPAPKVHTHKDHVFLVLHAPESGRNGHVHYVELDLFLSSRYLVTVHGPLNPAVDPKVAMVETGAVAERMDSGRWTPATPADLAHSILTNLTRSMTDNVAQLVTATWKLEQTVTSGHFGDPETVLEEMFRVRHGLQSVRTMAALGLEVFERLERVGAVAEQDSPLLADTMDQFGRVRNMAETQIDYLQGVIMLYQTRANTKMTVAAERLAVIAAVTLPVTAVSSILGMNVIVSEHTHVPTLILLLVLMGTMSLVLLAWAKRQGWW